MAPPLVVDLLREDAGFAVAAAGEAAAPLPLLDAGWKSKNHLITRSIWLSAYLWMYFTSIITDIKSDNSSRLFCPLFLKICYESCIFLEFKVVEDP